MKYDFIEMQFIYGEMTLFITVDKDNYKQVKKALNKAFNDSLITACDECLMHALFTMDNANDFLNNVSDPCIWVQVNQWKDNESLMELFDEYRD